MTLDLSSVEGVSIQFTLWHYAVTGDICERSAVIAEGHPEIVAGAWDRTAADLATEVISRGDEPYRRVKDWSALPWVGEHMLRGHEEWAGL